MSGREAYPVDIVKQASNKRLTLTFIGQDGWLDAQEGYTNSTELDSAGLGFMEMILNGPLNYPVLAWLVVPEHELIRILKDKGLYTISFKIYDDSEETMIVMRLRNENTEDRESIATKPTNEYEF